MKATPAALLGEQDKGRSSEGKYVRHVTTHEWVFNIRINNLMLILRPFLLSQWLHTEEIASCLHAPVTRAQSSAAAAGPWQPVGLC